MRGFPRPGRNGDDRGHLISCVAGGGYDINLVPMDAALNRGWFLEGERFRAMERKSASTREACSLFDSYTTTKATVADDSKWESKTATDCSSPPSVTRAADLQQCQWSRAHCHCLRDR